MLISLMSRIFPDLWFFQLMTAFSMATPLMANKVRPLLVASGLLLLAIGDKGLTFVTFDRVKSSQLLMPCEFFSRFRVKSFMMT